jgi:hypothetical protein
MATISSTAGTTGADTQPVRAVTAVAERLRVLVDGLAPQDGVAVFGGVYLTATEAVAGGLASGALFRDPAATARLDMLFADRFFSAFGPGPAPACWRPLLELRLHPDIAPVQFALAGMNAHIEHDLPLSVVDTCELLRCSPDELSVDFHHVNDVLARVEEGVRERLMPSAEESGVADPLLHLLSSWSIDRAREAAWASAVTLWELRDRPHARAAAAAALGDGTGLVSRCLLTPVHGRTHGGQ